MPKGSSFQTSTFSGTLPVLGSDRVTQAIARQHDDGSGAVERARALGALVDRDYEAAAAAFATSEARGAADLRPLRAYARYLAGHGEMARALADTARPVGPDEQHFWHWLRQRLDAPGTAGRASTPAAR